MRPLRFLWNTLLHGTAYGVLKELINRDQPLDEHRVWNFITGHEPSWRRWIREAWPPQWLRRLAVRSLRLQDAVLGVREHYDVSNDFYKLFLDPKFMFYSCADHLRGDESLVEAQTNKANHILTLLDPKPGEKILELGCGWASMMRYIEEHTGDRSGLTGYTASLEQAAYIKENFGYDIRVENFFTAEYPKEHYDKVYSIGAWEGVRLQDADPLMKKVYDTLKPGGRFVLHFFCRLQDRLPSSMSVAQIFFPGHVAISYRQHVQAMERAGFRITGQTCHDYRQTLRQWFENLVARREEALKLVDVRTYNRYVVFFPASYKFFNDRMGILFRFVLSKPPLTAGPYPKPPTPATPQ